MFEWLFHPAAGHEHCALPPPVHPKDLPYSVSRVMLNRELDIPFYNKYWDYPLKAGGNSPEIIYSDKIRHVPLFSSRDQIVNTQCAGKLHFVRPWNPAGFQVHPADNAILTKPSHYVISSAESAGGKCADAGRGGALPVEFRIGGAGPGGPEMSAKQLGGARTSEEYQKHGPHYIGRVLRDGSYCLEPAAMEAKKNIVFTINDDIGNPPDSIIQTGYRTFLTLYSSSRRTL